jgi:serine-type D-Ala-D-Ala carboxypeptidase/endopeptidase (penicillin-binding protein 4)
VTAFETLGKDFTYKTFIAYDGKISEGRLDGNLYFIGSGDPSLGSWRWKETSEEAIQKKIISMLKEKKITAMTGDIIIDDSKWESQATPDGWIWQDIGNYYGAGAWALNWHENQYDLVMKPGKKVGEAVQVLKTQPKLQVDLLINELTTGKEGSGDNSIIYLAENGRQGTVRGTIPAGQETFTVKGSMPNAPRHFAEMIKLLLADNAISFSGKIKTSADWLATGSKMKYACTMLDSIVSPSFENMNKWFLEKSINLYGEAFVKTIAYEKNGFGSENAGLDLIRDFWNKQGIDKASLKIIDGSGLSPANRVTTAALAKVMLFARKQSWFNAFHNALPQSNGIPMKSGYISGVRSYTGYIKSTAGTDYTFAFIINNFDGSPSTVREKMFKLLNVLK